MYYLVAGLIFIFQAGYSQENENRKPNIILIMADDLGYETLGCNGSKEYHTPHLDKLAAEGMRFNQCHAMPLCTPSRIQLMTGRYNFRNYVGFGLLDPGEKTFGHYMQEAGYRTMVAGKWQLYGNEHQQKLAGGIVGTLPGEAGFDDYMLWQVKDRGYRYKSPTLVSKRDGLRTYSGEYAPDLLEAYIEDFISEKTEEPFFIYYPMALTHNPFLPTPEHPEFNAYDPDEKVDNPRYFDAMVTYMDQIVGKLVDKVRELGIADNTLILFIGDNGTHPTITSMFRGRVVHGNKGGTTDAGTHVPMIAWWPGKIVAGQVNENLIDLTDFLPTLMEVVHAEIPGNIQLDGISFYPQLLTGPDVKETRDWIFIGYDPHWGKFESRRYVFDQQWKLYGNGDIFDLTADIREERPLGKEQLSLGTRNKIDKFESVLKELR